MYFHFSDPRPRRIIAVLMFFISSAQHGGMSVCHQVMMSGVKCHPHIRRTRGENNNPHQHYTQHENQGNLMVAATRRIHTTLAEAWSILCDGAVIDTDSALWFLKLVWDTGGQQWALSVIPVTGQTYLISPNILPLLPLFKQTHLIFFCTHVIIWRPKFEKYTLIIILLIIQVAPLINPCLGEREHECALPRPMYRARPTSIWKHKLLWSQDYRYNLGYLWFS